MSNKSTINPKNPKKTLKHPKQGFHGNIGLKLMVLLVCEIWRRAQA